ncbi:type I restriction-modification system subunit M [Aegicerativicinus sediminis]|uniref:type I restriction-modification system subunit M n=1 Tax=Aegicerativicinus sediminis TaxID=2893202 RepID=UPI001E5395B8|nr:class I SAM-dependent DNA methyltransferase [Aegicerativicinus sediminis]
MPNSQEISSFIWNVCDDVLRGLFKQHEYGDVILPFLVLRRLDCVIEPQKDTVIRLYNELKDDVEPAPIIMKQTGLRFYNRSNFDLQRLKGDPNGLKNNFPNYINGFSHNVFEILENFQLDKPVQKLLKNNKLYLLIDKFTDIDLHPDKVDNHTMGQIFEELLRKFSEMSNETSGEHYTPRDIVKLLVSLVFAENKEKLTGSGIIRSIFDPCCGTGGMLTIGKDWISENIPNQVMVNLYGQELNPQTYSICKSDMLITGEDPDNIRLGSSLSFDQFEGRKFDYMITNPPFGVSWKSEKDFIDEESKNPYGRFGVGTPRSSDGSLLFLQHMISKMKDEGSRIGVIFNGSPLFTGDAGSGESEIRRWIIENDWLECIVALPDQLFFNTGISTYIWIVTNDKKPNRKGKVQLIDGSQFYKAMKKSLGSKRKEISSEQCEELINTYNNFEENEYSKIYDNEFFGYTKVVIEQPLKENGELVSKKDGSLKADTSLRDSERIPLTDDVEEYYNREVKPHLPNSWMDRDKDKVGYEINFTKYFYTYKPLRPLNEITKDLLALERESENLLKEIL